MLPFLILKVTLG